MPRGVKKLRHYSKRYLRKWSKRFLQSSSENSSKESRNDSTHSNFLRSCSAESASITDHRSTESVRIEQSSEPNLREPGNEVDRSSSVEFQHSTDSSEFSFDQCADQEENRFDGDLSLQNYGEAPHANDFESPEESSEDGLDNSMNVDDKKDGILYEGAQLTVNESRIAVLSMATRHNLTREAQADLLRFRELHCPLENKCEKTLYKFRKAFKQSETPLIRHYYCGTCYQVMEARNSVCASCLGLSEIKYFLQVSIISQLKALYKRPGFRLALHRNYNRRRRYSENFSDIYDGHVYRELRQSYELLGNTANISMTMYTDGVKIFNSGKFSIWPIYLAINELPFSMRFRRENVILASLWFGDKKPAANLFMMPLANEMRELHQGIEVQAPERKDPFLVKGIVICFTADLPARALFYNMKQYNGHFGCQKCTQEGVYLRREKRMTYPYAPSSSRTDDGTTEHAQRAFDTGEVVCGVKGPTAMKLIVHNYMRAIAIDVMHCVHEGVVKSLLHLFFSSKFSHEAWSIYHQIGLVDKRLNSFRIPSFMQRMVRSISEFVRFWKGHEYKAWLLYYSVPCLQGILDDKYFEHYLLLVLGISLLSQSDIRPEEVDVASRALHEFVGRFAELYEPKYMSSNVHQLLHLAENVRQFGPLRTTSCFPFEDLNGKLKKLVHGSKAAQLQICTGLSKYLHITTLKDEYIREGGPAQKFCHELSSKFGKMKRFRVDDGVYIVGKCNELNSPGPDIVRLYQRESIAGTRFIAYNRLLKDNIMYSSTEYRRTAKTDSSFAKYSADDGSSKIGRIRRFVRVTTCHCAWLCDCLADNYAIIRPCTTENQISSQIAGYNLSYIHSLLGCGMEEEAINISQIESVCFYLKIMGPPNAYLIEPVNLIEFE